MTYLQKAVFRIDSLRKGGRELCQTIVVLLAGDTTSLEQFLGLLLFEVSADIDASSVDATSRTVIKLPDRAP